MTRPVVVTPPARASQPQSRARRFPLVLLAIVAFTGLALAISPYLYDAGNGGRYLVGVLQTLDPRLFPDDAIAASLAGFESLFYLVLGGALRLAGASPESLPAVMTALYVAYRALLLFLLYRLARRLSDGPWLFLLAATWATVMQTPPLGGSQLFAHTLRHTEIAILFCLGALVALHDGRPLPFYLLTAVALLVHPLVGLQFALCLVPITLWETWRSDRGVPRPYRYGLASLAAAAAVYALFMAPPAFMPAEAAIFVEAKGTINHIAFTNTPPLRWLQAGSLLLLASVAAFRWLRDSRPARRLLLAASTGAGASLALSALATATRWVPLMQFQPLRTFLWVYFLAMLVILMAAVRAWRDSIPLAALLMLYAALAMLNAPAAVVLALAAGAASIVARPPVEGPVVRLAFAGLLLLSILGFLLQIGGGLSTLDPGAASGPLGALLGGQFILLAPALLLFLLLPQARPRWRWASLLVIIVVFAATLYGAQEIAVDRAGVALGDWREMTDYIRGNTAVDARFLSTYDGEAFRTRALRTAVAHNHGALAWVDPATFATQNEIATAVKEARVNGDWDLEALFAIARAHDVDAVIVHGRWQGVYGPTFQYGEFRLFEVPR